VINNEHLNSISDILCIFDQVANPETTRHASVRFLKRGSLNVSVTTKDCGPESEEFQRESFPFLLSVSATSRRSLELIDIDVDLYIKRASHIFLLGVKWCRPTPPVPSPKATHILPMRVATASSSPKISKKETFYL
jgi:hypothetical protein